jgi:hypothetical protein
LIRADERSARGPCFNDKDAEGTPANNSVSHGEGLTVGFDAHRKLGDDRARGGDFFSEFFVFWWVKFQ